MGKSKPKHGAKKAKKVARLFLTNGNKPRGSLLFKLSNGREIKVSREAIMSIIMSIMMEKRKQEEIKEEIRNLRVKIGELFKRKKSIVSGQFGQIHFDMFGPSEAVFKLIPLINLIMKEDISSIEQMRIKNFISATRSEIQFYNLIDGVQEFRNSHCPRRLDVQKTTECVAIIYDDCGPDLFSYLEKHRHTMNELGLLDLAIKVLNVCLAMFKAEIYHLDIKPENILYDGRRVMICDWGRWTNNANKIINQAGTLEFTAPLGHPARFYALWTIMATLADIMFVYSPQYSDAEGNDHKLEIIDWLNKWNKAECTNLEPLSRGFTMNCDLLAENPKYLLLCSLFRDFFSETPKKSYTLADIIDVFLETKASVIG